MELCGVSEFSVGIPRNNQNEYPSTSLLRATCLNPAADKAIPEPEEVSYSISREVGTPTTERPASRKWLFFPIAHRDIHLYIGAPEPDEEALVVGG